MKAYGERRQSSKNFEPKHYVEFSVQLHVPVIFLPVNPTKEGSCGLNALDRKILSSLPRIEPRFHVYHAVAQSPKAVIPTLCSEPKTFYVSCTFSKVIF